MSAQHTAGPWKVHGGMLGHKGDIFVPTAKSIKDCHHIARCFAPKPPSAPLCDLQVIQSTREAVAIIEANARLIAAAPAMREYIERKANAGDAEAAVILEMTNANS